MKRDAINQLIKWKESKRRKPLIVEGARQVGKTWLVKEFASQHYRNLMYVNFEDSAYLRDLFTADFDVHRILDILSAETHQRCVPGETLIFLDEIQEAKHGITVLKYFYENMPEQHVIVAGSLLGISLHRHESFPVGKVQFMTLYPLSYTEFLEAMGEEGLAGFIRKQDHDKICIFREKYIELLKTYYYVGGMPEAVLSFSEEKDWREVREIQKYILNGYDRDFSKHAPIEIVPRIRMLWNSLPAQLGRENRKFVYGLIKEGARAREYKMALQWLYDAGMVHRVNCVSAPRMPLKSYEDISSFKLFVVDTGLLCAMSGLSQSTIVNGNTIFTEFKGALTEQYVLQQLILKHKPYYYSKSNSRMEIDFLIQDEENIIPIEVKAEENLRAKSLRLFVEEFDSKIAYRVSMSSYREESWMTNLPLYCVQML